MMQHTNDTRATTGTGFDAGRPARRPRVQAPLERRPAAQPRHRHRPAALRLLAATVASGAATAGLVGLGTRLPGGLPTGADIDAVRQWLATTPLDATVMRLAWAGATGTAGYLTAVHAAAGLATAVHATRALHLADRLSGGLVRRLSVTGIAAGLGTAVVVAPVSGAAAPTVGHGAAASVDPPVLVLDAAPAPAAPGAPTLTLKEASDPMPQRAAVPASAPGAPSLVLEPASQPAPPAPVLRLEPTPATGAAPVGQAAPEAPISVGPAGDVDLETPIITTGLGVWIVRPGDSLWSIAEAVLQERSGTPADLEAVEPYWHRLIAANRELLADPANPDLLFTGQQLTLPPR